MHRPPEHTTCRVPGARGLSFTIAPKTDAAQVLTHPRRKNNNMIRLRNALVARRHCGAQSPSRSTTTVSAMRARLRRLAVIYCADPQLRPSALQVLALLAKWASEVSG